MTAPTPAPEIESARSHPLSGVLRAPGAVAGQARRRYREVERVLARRAPARALTAVPRTARFLGATFARRYGEAVAGLPVPSLSPGLAAQVAIDETLLAVASGPNRMPRRADYERVGAELAHARLLFDNQGWLDDPASYHRSPPPLVDPAVDHGWALGQRYERLLFNSGWLPRPDEPGADRWASYGPNRTAVAAILRHEGAPRPWVMAVHGFACGYPFMDFIGLHALHLHRDLGLNVAMPVLPFHGPRKVTRLSGEAMLSFDLVNTVHALTQAIWDLRRLLTWIHAQDAQGVAVYGVSLGAYVSALLVGLEDDIDCVVAGIPVVDFPKLFRSHSPHHIRMRAIEHEILDGNAEIVHGVVSPLAFAPRVPRAGRFIYAGLGDRMAPPPQAHALWRHWDEPEICWYAGNHVGYLWAKDVGAFLDRSLISAGFGGSADSDP
ncbi:MAG TPA: alpha/beta hydrolase [Acidimicrobiales bacterium]|nr:alpha/beta hydrolase [Acidimicrobiales bacterium]